MPTYVTRPDVAPMPNLENLRKQAKLYVRWHRDAPPSGGGADPRRAAALQGPDRASDLDAAFKLGDAQELVARQAGFETWQALETGVQTMSDTVPTAVSQPTLTAVEAALFVADIKASCAFFTGKLGFSVVFTYGEPPFYGQVKRDVARLNLRMVCEPVFVGDIREREELLAASMTVGKQIVESLPTRLR